MALTLTWKETTKLPVDGTSLRPDSFVGYSVESISNRQVRVGNADVALGDLFAVEGDCGDSSLILEGNLKAVRRIGWGMTGGSIRIHGDCGHGVGQGMHAGLLVVDGSVGDSAGAAMRGGFLHIKGSAGDNLGGAEPGERLGMRDGVIFVEGNAGNDVGLAMRRGLIAIGRTCGTGAGRGMVAGSIFAFGSIGRYVGLGMKRGTLAVFGDEVPEMGPGFFSSGFDRPTFLTIYLKRMAELGFPVPRSAHGGILARYNGDRAEGGQGEILVASRS